MYSLICKQSTSMSQITWVFTDCPSWNGETLSTFLNRKLCLPQSSTQRIQLQGHLTCRRHVQSGSKTCRRHVWTMVRAAFKRCLRCQVPIKRNCRCDSSLAVFSLEDTVILVQIRTSAFDLHNSTHLHFFVYMPTLCQRIPHVHHRYP